VLTLSVREFQLLVAMVEHAGGIIGREELTRVVWGRELRPGDRSVDVYVSKLRAKLENAVPGKRYIHTHPSFGYRFQPEEFAPPTATSRSSRGPMAARDAWPMRVLERRAHRPGGSLGGIATTAAQITIRHDAGTEGHAVEPAP
jgi:hypothetical protein